MICSECGTVNNDSAKFCKQCGSALNSQKTIEKTDFLDNSPKSSNNKTLIICITAILCVAILAIGFVMISGDSSDSTTNSDSVNVGAVSNEENSVSNGGSSVAKEDSYQESSNIFIKHCDFYTGSSSSDKSYCSANIGPEHYGEEYKISVLYSSAGSNLNDGKSVSKKVDEEGFLHISTSNAFDYYPDTAHVTIYNTNGDILTEKTYYLETHSGQQQFD